MARLLAVGVALAAIASLVLLGPRPLSSRAVTGGEEAIMHYIQGEIVEGYGKDKTFVMEVRRSDLSELEGVLLCVDCSRSARSVDGASLVAGTVVTVNMVGTHSPRSADPVVAYRVSLGTNVQMLEEELEKAQGLMASPG